MQLIIIIAMYIQQHNSILMLMIINIIGTKGALQRNAVNRTVSWPSVFSDHPVNSSTRFWTSRQLTVQLTAPSILTFVTWPRKLVTQCAIGWRLSRDCRATFVYAVCLRTVAITTRHALRLAKLCRGVKVAVWPADEGVVVKMWLLSNLSCPNCNTIQSNPMQLTVSQKNH